jgi:nicotinate dehydrogenase subunit A
MKTISTMTVNTKTISLKVNGQEHTVEVDPATPLLFVLSDELGLRGPKFGCGLAQCGACTVILTPAGETRAVRGPHVTPANEHGADRDTPGDKSEAGQGSHGKAVRSCVMPVGSVGTAEVTTLEGLGTPEKPHAIQQAFIDEGAAQCGFCLSGVIMTAKAALDEKPGASDEEIREALGGVLCRCFVHERMLRAIRKYAEGLKH